MQTNAAGMSYPEFQPNQVLADQDLNQLRDYLESQTLATRVHAIGNGILCGLVIQSTRNGASAQLLNPQSVTIDCGAGITSEGYLIAIPECANLDAIVPYVDSNQTSELPFPAADDEQTHLCYELVRAVDYDGEFTPKMLEALWAMDTEEHPLGSNPILLLYLEFKVIPRLKCSFDDCDDKGLNIEVHVRKLLIPQLPQWEVDPFAKIRRTDLHPLRMPRVYDFTGPQNIEAAFYGVARGVDLLDSISEKLMLTLRVYEDLLNPHYPTASVFGSAEGSLPDEIQDRIKSRLQTALGQSNGSLAQLNYDFMRDLIAAYNEFIAAAAQLNAECCPPTRVFKRHILLGQLRMYSEGEHVSRFRHYFRPTPAFTGQETLARKLVALHKRMEGMIDGFDPSKTLDTSVRIRPQQGIALSPRVIPYYYDLSAAAELESNWNPDQHDPEVPTEPVLTFNGPPDTVSDSHPAAQSLDDMGFLRIEGHLGNRASSPEATRNEIENLRDSLRLPFDVVLLAHDWPVAPNTATEDEIRNLPNHAELAERYTGIRAKLLDTLHHVGFFFRDLENQRSAWIAYLPFALDPVDTLMSAVKDCTSSLPPELALLDAADFESKYAHLVDEAALALGKTAWYLNDAVAGQLIKTKVGGATQTVGKSVSAYYGAIPLPFHEMRQTLLMVFQHLDVNGLRSLWQRVVESVGEGQPEPFTQFVGRHPGIEHVSGVTKGGTFILLSDGEEITADFYAPYACCEGPPPGWMRGSYFPMHYIYIERDWNNLPIAINEAAQLGGPLHFQGVAKLLVRTANAWLELEHGISVGIARADGVVGIAGQLRLENDQHENLVLNYTPRIEPQWETQLDVKFQLQSQKQSASGDWEPWETFYIWLHLIPPLMIAHDDTAVTVMDRPVTIDFLENDLIPEGFENSIGVKIENGPFHGTLGRPTGGSSAFIKGRVAISQEILDKPEKITVELGNQSPLEHSSVPGGDTAQTFLEMLNLRLKQSGFDLSASLDEAGVLELRHNRVGSSYTFSAASSTPGILSPEAGELTDAQPGEDAWIPLARLLADDPDLLAAGQIDYLPDPSFVGTDYFEYSVGHDWFGSHNLTTRARVNIHIADCCLPPEEEEPTLPLPPIEICLERLFNSMVERQRNIEDNAVSKRVGEYIQFVYKWRSLLADPANEPAYRDGMWDQEVVPAVQKNFTDLTQYIRDSEEKPDHPTALDYAQYHLYQLDFTLCYIKHQPKPTYDNFAPLREQILGELKIIFELSLEFRRQMSTSVISVLKASTQGARAEFVNVIDLFIKDVGEL